MKALRILQVGNFGYKYRQFRWYDTEHKLAQGLTRAGHFVLRFSDRDEARYATVFHTSELGAARLRKRLVETARHFLPHLILFHHADLIVPRTFRILRETVPNVRMAQINVDPTANRSNVARFMERTPFMDLSFLSTADRKAVGRSRTTDDAVDVAFFPNPVDSSVETAQTFRVPASDLAWDAAFFGAGYGLREGFLRDLRKTLPQDFRFHVGGGALTTPRLHSTEFLDTLAKAAASPCVPGDDDVMETPFLYSSSRIAQILGQGVVALTPRSSRQSTLYEDGVVEFASREECAAGMVELWRDDAERRRRGEIGWKIAHSRTGSTRVARYVCEAVFGEAFSEVYEWPTERNFSP